MSYSSTIYANIQHSHGDTMRGACIIFGYLIQSGMKCDEMEWNKWNEVIIPFFSIIFIIEWQKDDFIQYPST